MLLLRRQRRQRQLHLPARHVRLQCCDWHWNGGSIVAVRQTTIRRLVRYCTVQYFADWFDSIQSLGVCVRNISSSMYVFYRYSTEAFIHTILIASRGPQEGSNIVDMFKQYWGTFPCGEWRRGFVAGCCLCCCCFCYRTRVLLLLLILLLLGQGICRI